MKKTVLYLLLLWQTVALPQSESEIKKLLLAKFPDKGKGDEWVYNKEDGELLKFNMPLINSRLKNTEFYKVALTFIDDKHVFNSNCIIMYNKTTKDLQMLPPIWYGGLKEEFYKKLIGIKLLEKNEIKSFATEFETILLNDSNEHCKEIIFEDNAITYKITLNNSEDEEVSDIIKVIFKNNTVTEIQRICAKHLDVEKSIK